MAVAQGWKSSTKFFFPSKEVFSITSSINNVIQPTDNQGGAHLALSAEKETIFSSCKFCAVRFVFACGQGKDEGKHVIGSHGQGALQQRLGEPQLLQVLQIEEQVVTPEVQTSDAVWRPGRVLAGRQAEPEPEHPAEIVPLHRGLSTVPVFQVVRHVAVQVLEAGQPRSRPSQVKSSSGPPGPRQRLYCPPPTLIPSLI